MMLRIPIEWRHNTYIQFSKDDSLMFITNQNLTHVGVIGVCACDTWLARSIQADPQKYMQVLTVYPLGLTMTYKEMLEKTYDWFIDEILCKEDE